MTLGQLEDPMDLNNCSQISNESGSVEQYLARLQDQTDITMIPAVVMMAVFSLTGLVGNSLVLVVYSQKFKLSPTKVLIMTIAVFDLVSNVAAIPSEANIMFDSWNFNSPWVCKSKVFLGSFTTVGGAVSLMIVAVIRYRKVCRYNGWQMTIRQSIAASVGTAIFSFVFSIPYVIIYGIHTRQTPCPNIQGYECFADDRFFSTPWPLVNNLLFVALYLSLSVSMVVLYIFIGVTAWKHSRLHGVNNDGVKFRTNKDNSSTDAASVDDLKREDSSQNTSTLKDRVAPKRLVSLLCCTNLLEGGEREEQTHSSSLVLKTYTTSGTESADSESGEACPDKENPKIHAGVGHEFISPLYFSISSKAENFAAGDLADISVARTTAANKANWDMPDSNSPAASYVHQQNLTNVETSGAKTHQGSTKITQTPMRCFPIKKPANQKVDKKSTSNRRPLGRVTAMLIIISAIFVLGYLPFLMLTIVKNRMPDTYASLSSTELSVFNLFYRLYFLNSAANAIIYSLCDVHFRRECYKLLTCTSRRFFD